MLNIFCTEFCNRKCYYCDIPNLEKRRTIKKEDIEYWFPFFEKYFKDKGVILTGGELGLIDPDTMDVLMNYSSKFNNLYINTNGIWLQRYYDRYKDVVSKIVLHDNEDIVDVNVNDINDNKIIRAFLIHKQNKKYLKDLINILDKETIFYFYDIKDLKNTDLILNNSDINEILNNFNIKKCVINNNVYKNLKYIINNPNLIKLLRKTCSAYWCLPSVDLVNKRIKNCPNSHTNTPYIELTEENFVKVLNNEIKFEKNVLCDNCYNFVYIVDTLINKIIKKKGKI